MTDIVETLRQGSLNKDDYRWKAADEIEKLREQLETAYMYGHDMAKAEYRHCVQEVEGENDRLLAENERLRQEIKQNEVDLEEYRLDVERLRAALVDCRVELDDYYMREYRSDDPIIQQRLEEKMASNPARTALEGK